MYVYIHIYVHTYMCMYIYTPHFLRLGLHVALHGVDDIYVYRYMYIYMYYIYIYIYIHGGFLTLKFM